MLVLRSDIVMRYITITLGSLQPFRSGAGTHRSYDPLSLDLWLHLLSSSSPAYRIIGAYHWISKISLEHRQSRLLFHNVVAHTDEGILKAAGLRLKQPWDLWLYLAHLPVLEWFLAYSKNISRHGFFCNIGGWLPSC